jgi:hypothetical protein
MVKNVTDLKQTADSYPSDADQTESSHKPESVQGVLDIGFLAAKVARAWWFILLIVALGAAKGMWNMHIFTPMSVAKMIVAPIANQGDIGQSRAGVSGAVFGILPQFGVTTVSKITNFDRMMHAFSTISFAERLQEKHNLIQSIFEISWEEAQKNTTPPPLGTFEWRRKMDLFLNMPTWSPLTMEDLAGYLSSRFMVADVPNTNFKEVSFTHEDPDTAKWFLWTLYSEATEYIREQDQRELEQHREYLERRLAATRIIELRQALVGLLANQARKEMTLQKGLPFTGRVIEPPYVSKYKTRPKPLTMVGVPTFLAFVLSLAAVVGFVIIRNE